MKKVTLTAFALLAVLLTPAAYPQISGPPYNPAAVNITGGTIGGATTVGTSGTIGSFDVGSLPGLPSNSGAYLYSGNGFESLMLQRAGETAGNRREYVGFQGDGVKLGFFNDQSGTQTPAITVSGGAASGITGITSSSGSGSWAHTGAFSATGVGASGSLPALTLTNTGNGADQKTWDIRASSTALEFRTLTDAGAGTSWLNAIRGGGSNVASLQITPDTFVAGLLYTNGGIRMIPKTVATLPTCDTNAQGNIYTVNDATAPAYGATLAGGGAVTVIALCDGTNWTAH